MMMGGRVVASLKLTASLPLKIGWLGDNPCFSSWGLAHFSGAFAVSCREGTFLPNQRGGHLPSRWEYGHPAVRNSQGPSSCHRVWKFQGGERGGSFL